jgi:hypothetical protein
LTDGVGCGLQSGKVEFIRGVVMLEVGQHLNISGFPNLRLEVTRIVLQAIPDPSEARVNIIEIVLRYLDPSARLIDLKLPRVKTIIDILDSRLGYMPESIIIKTDDGKLFATLEADDHRSYFEEMDFGDFDQFEDVVNKIYFEKKA